MMDNRVNTLANLEIEITKCWNSPTKRPKSDFVANFNTKINRLIANKEDELSILLSMSYTVDEELNNFEISESLQKLIKAAKNELEQLQTLKHKVNNIM